jgi:uncharacterized membrane protein
MSLFEAVLMAAAFLCSLVAGFLFAFAVVVMPGIRSLDDGAFIRAFQVIDRIIQNNQPVFVLVWAGSVLAVTAAGVMAIWTSIGVDRLLTVTAALVYLLGVQVPTFTINVPLNNQLQRVDVAAMTKTARQRARETFEARWNRWNVIRTALAGFVSVLLMVLLLRA